MLHLILKTLYISKPSFFFNHFRTRDNKISNVLLYMAPLFFFLAYRWIPFLLAETTGNIR